MEGSPRVGKRLLFGGEEIVNTWGSYCQIKTVWPEEITLDFPGPDLIRRNLSLIYGIGPKTAENLRASGFDTLEKLTAHSQWGRAAKEVCRLIERRDLERLQSYGAREEELIGFFSRPDVVFIDVETTGFYSVHPLFLVGLFYFEGETPVVLQSLARDFTEEKAMLDGVTNLLRRFKVAISYNGRSFDLPYLLGRVRFHGLTWDGFPQQLDLLRQTRRFFKGTIPDCRLATAGRYLLGLKRADAISGGEVPERYHSFIETGDEKLIAEILLHNREDLLTMAGLVRVIKENWKGLTQNAG